MGPRLLGKETLPPGLGGKERFPCPVFPKAFGPVSKSVLSFLPYFLARVGGVERCLHHDVTVLAALGLPKHDVSGHELLAGRMLSAMQVTISPEERLALRGLAGNLQKKAELVDGLNKNIRVWLGQSQNIQINRLIINQ